MLNSYLLFRKVLTWFVVLIVGTFLGEFALSVAREHHLFEEPTAKLGAALHFLGAIRDLPGFWPTLSVAAGLTVGMWLDTLARKRVKAERYDAPSVRDWLRPLQAIEQFVDHDLSLKNTNAQNTAAELKKKWTALTAEIENKSTVDLEILATRGKAPEYVALKKQRDDAYREYQAAEFTARLHRDAVMDNFVNQLRDGHLIAKGFAVKNGELQEHEQYIRATFWKIIPADRYILDLETAKAAGPYNTYENLYIGENTKFQK
jgi:hypothetical protein